jgi:UDP-N-acetylmuramoylalanine--D-glutamate ligase
MDAYFSDKANIFRNQKPGDILIVNKDVRARVHSEHPPVEAVSPDPIPPEWKLKMPGMHNRENAAFAAAALRRLGMDDQVIRAGLESFEGVEGRLQLVREINGVKIYNDNNATTPEATVAALRALEKDIALIIGGSEKNLKLDELVSEIKNRVSSVFLLTHPKYQGSVRLAEALKSAGVAHVEVVDLVQALDVAIKSTKTGSILFSPAFASFGIFKNEYERNDQFLEIVRKLP